MIVEKIDWDLIEYDGGFNYKNTPENKSLLQEKNVEYELMKLVDRALSHYSYLCYLRETKTLKEKDLVMFEYELRRIVANKHISNYLFSIYHFSKNKNDGVKCSYYYLIHYSVKNNYLSPEFYNPKTNLYKSFLQI